MKSFFAAFFILVSFSAWATNEIDLLKTNDDVSRFLIKHVSRREFKDASPFEGYAKIFTGNVRHTFYKTDIDRNGETDLVIDGQGALLAVMALSKRYRLYRLDTSIGYSSPTDLVAIDSTAKIPKLIVQRNQQRIDTLVYRFNTFIEYTATPDTTLSFDSLVWNAYWNGDLRVKLKVYPDLRATYTNLPERWSSVNVITLSGIYSRKTYNQLVELLQYIRLKEMQKSYNDGQSHTDHCITRISVNGETITIDDYGGDGTFGLRKLYTIMHEIRESVKTQR